ncbi:aminotransferase class V-fold PLP-dependent enzyme [Ammonicoccus fulvus]|uniref:Aminotransferase class V-fold PLP-dependent enzyme n=1 Tax=Ammonicoccus fulvus TaxID=3138240 RepID=A0ABZ3FRK2_9ACTN
MSLPLPDVDPDGLLEYSVVFSDRSLNHMSKRFVGVMQDLLSMLRETYAAPTAVMIPGGGSYAMEAVARQFAHGRRVLVLRNGFFSYRWSQIIEAGAITDHHTVLKASPDSADRSARWIPAPIDEVVARIEAENPEFVFAPHVETAAGIVLPDDYVRAVADATHAAGGLFVLDCVASGPLWVDMGELGVDILISAPQKGWSGSPSAGYVMLGADARTAIEATTSSSFAIDLKKWMTISEGYAEGKHAYHATVPTDTIRHNVEVMKETLAAGREELRAKQQELGEKVRAMLEERGYVSVAAEGFESPTVVVCHEPVPGRSTAGELVKAGVQAAAGVPLACDEPADFATVRFGLFGLDKWADVDGTVQRLADALDRIA